MLLLLILLEDIDGQEGVLLNEDMQQIELLMENRKKNWV